MKSRQSPKMTFDQECAHTIQRHMKAKFGWEPSVEELLSEPRHKRVWAWWEALAYFREKNHFERLEDAPEGLEWITVMDGSKKNYKWVNGEYVFNQELTKEDCKRIYGD